MNCQQICKISHRKENTELKTPECVLILFVEARYKCITQL